MYQYLQPSQHPFQQNINVIKSYFKSPIVLALAIFGIINIIVTFFTSFSFSGTLASMFVLSNADAFDSISDAQNAVVIINILSKIPAIIFPILMTVGFFTLYLKSNDTNPLSTPNTGAGILSIVSLLRLIGAIILMVLLIIYLVLSFILLMIFLNKPKVTVSGKLINTLSIGTLSTTNSELVFATFFMTIICVLIIILVLSYYISQYKFYRGIKENLNSPTLTYKGATAYGVYNVIISSVLILSGLFILAMGNSLEHELFSNLSSSVDFTMMPIFFVSALMFWLPATEKMLIAILALGYKSHVQAAMYVGVGTEDHAQPHAPASHYTKPMHTQQPPTNSNASIEQVKTENMLHRTNDELTIACDNTNKSDNLRVCPACSKERLGNSPFCGYCGHKFK